ncbi:MAG: adenylosuccinate synthase [Patescibacteria group bacterium]|nr:adenylosuccinate synthase [Patescibacteria group bacterium]
MSVDVIIGLQRGDEGKGRFVDMMAEDHDIVARFNGGNNAGHTVVLPDGRDLALHLVPSGIAHEHAMNIIGNGTVVNPVKLIEEIDDIRSKDIEVSRRNLLISCAAQLVLPHHICADEIREAGQGGQGSTKSGIAQVFSSKASRTGVRMREILSDPQAVSIEAYEGLRALRDQREKADLPKLDEEEIAHNYMISVQKVGEYVTDTVLFLNQQLRKEKPARVLAEGAQAYLLDIDHGMYPFVTSSTTTSGGVATGLGIPPYLIDKVTGVVKAVQSHVGGGPFVTEVHDKEALQMLHGDMSTIDAEKGTTTGRVRRLGYLDLPQIRRAQMVNGTHDVALSKLDWFPRYGDDAPICVAYEFDGVTTDIAPGSADELLRCKPVFETLPTWEEDIQGVRNFSDLPENAQKAVEFIEDRTNVPISMIGVGPNREQVIIR